VKSLDEMLQRLKENEMVLGLVEYGSARNTDDVIEGDYDLIVVLEEYDPKVESLHFFVGGVPVDLNLRSIDSLAKMKRAEGFESVLLRGRVIHDPSGRVQHELDALRERQEALPLAPLDPSKIGGLRHGARHTFGKIRSRGKSNPTLTRYLLHQCVYWAVQQYFEIRGIEYQGEKHALAFLEAREPALYEAIEGFYASTNLDELVSQARRIEEIVLSPVGGLWQEGEILTFGDPHKGEKMFKRLFGEEWGGSTP